MPSKRRINTKPIPRMGGIAIFGGFAVAMLVGAIVIKLGYLPGLLINPGTFNPLGVLIGAAVMFLTGTIDDVRQISPKAKLAGQVVAACIAVTAGVRITDVLIAPGGASIELGLLTYPITIFYIVAFANVFNLIDGLDGLAAGVCTISAAAFCFLSVTTNAMTAATASAALMGACIAFLRFNFNPASIFMGDSGSLTIGYLLGVISAVGMMRTSAVTTLAAPIIIAGIPILDTFSAIVRRLREHKPIDAPDTNHIHHALLKSGFSQRRVVLSIWAISAVLAFSGIAVADGTLYVKIAVVAFDLLVAGFLVWKLQLFGPVLRHHILRGSASDQRAESDESTEAGER